MELLCCCEVGKCCVGFVCYYLTCITIYLVVNVCCVCYFYVNSVASVTACMFIVFVLYSFAWFYICSTWICMALRGLCGFIWFQMGSMASNGVIWFYMILYGFALIV